VVGFLCTDSAADALISLNFCCCSHGLLEHRKPLVTRVITCCEDLEELQRLFVLAAAILSASFWTGSSGFQLSHYLKPVVRNQHFDVETWRLSHLSVLWTNAKTRVFSMPHSCFFFWSSQPDRVADLQP
jgi:hypothetical protein